MRIVHLRLRVTSPSRSRGTRGLNHGGRGRRENRGPTGDSQDSQRGRPSESHGRRTGPVHAPRERCRHRDTVMGTGARSPRRPAQPCTQAAEHSVALLGGPRRPGHHCPPPASRPSRPWELSPSPYIESPSARGPGPSTRRQPTPSATAECACIPDGLSRCPSQPGPAQPLLPVYFQELHEHVNFKGSTSWGCGGGVAGIFTEIPLTLPISRERLLSPNCTSPCPGVSRGSGPTSTSWGTAKGLLQVVRIS